MSKVLQLARQVIGAEIEALQEMLGRLDLRIEAAVEVIMASQGRVVVVGMGKSGIIGQKIAATLASTGTPSFFVHPAEAFHGDLGMIKPIDVALMISNSGETKEVTRLIPFLEYQQTRIVAMTGCMHSTLARHAAVVLDVHVKREACNNNLAPTCSTTAALVMGDALAMALSSERHFEPEDFARLHPGGDLGRRLLTRVRDVMRTANLPTCAPEALFPEVIQEITRGRLGLVMVMEGGELTGIITDGDVRRTFVADGDFRTLRAREIMSRAPKSVSQNLLVAEAEEVMRKHKINSLVVKDEADRVVGVLQIYD